jgi:hypothetical protein
LAASGRPLLLEAVTHGHDRLNIEALLSKDRGNRSSRPALSQQSRSSSALRKSAAPGATGCAETSFACAGGFSSFPRSVGSQRKMQAGQSSSSWARPNHSIERTHNGGPLLLASSQPAAPLRSAHVKRWALKD